MEEHQEAPEGKDKKGRPPRMAYEESKSFFP